MKPKRLFKSSTTNYMWAGGNLPQEINLGQSNAQGLTVSKPQYEHPGNAELTQYTMDPQQIANQPMATNDAQLFGNPGGAGGGSPAGGIANAAGSVAGVISDSIKVDQQSMGNETLGTFNYGDASQITNKSALKGFQTGTKIGSTFGPVGTIVGGGIGAIAGSISGGKEARKQRDAAQDAYDNAVDNRFDNIDAQKGKYGGRLKQYGDGGKLENAGKRGMMKAKIALGSEFGNPAARRMTRYNPDTYTFEDGTTGTHYMGSYGKHAIPGIQKVDGKMQLLNDPKRGPESMEFESSEDAEYFAKNYKDVAPMMRTQFKDGGDLTEFNGQTHENGGIQLPAMDAEVEDGETSVDNYVFSDSLSLNKDMIKDLELPKGLTGKSFADASKHLNKKFPRENDMFANKAKERYFERLKAFQESVRPKEPNGLFRDGGFFKDRATRQSDRDVARWQKENIANNTDPITVNAPNNQRRLTMEPGKANDAINGISRMAPIITSGINLGRNMKPNEKLDLDMFNTSVPIEENLIDRSKIYDDINISARAADQGLRNASGGSRSSYLNNRLGLLDRTLSAQTNARISSDTADAAEKSRVAQLRLRQDAMNQRNRYGVQVINDQNEGVREGLTQDSIANLGNQMGDYGTEGYRRNSVNNMYDYKVDRYGNVYYKNKKKKD